MKSQSEGEEVLKKILKDYKEHAKSEKSINISWLLFTKKNPDGLDPTFEYINPYSVIHVAEGNHDDDGDKRIEEIDKKRFYCKYSRIWPGNNSSSENSDYIQCMFTIPVYDKETKAEFFKFLGIQNPKARFITYEIILPTTELKDRETIEYDEKKIEECIKQLPVCATPLMRTISFLLVPDPSLRSDLVSTWRALEKLIYRALVKEKDLEVKTLQNFFLTDKSITVDVISKWSGKVWSKHMYQTMRCRPNGREEDVANETLKFFLISKKNLDVAWDEGDLNITSEKIGETLEQRKTTWEEDEQNDPSESDPSESDSSEIDSSGSD